MTLPRCTLAFDSRVLILSPLNYSFPGAQRELTYFSLFRDIYIYNSITSIHCQTIYLFVLSRCQELCFH